MMINFFINNDILIQLRIKFIAFLKAENENTFLALKKPKI